MGIEKRWSRRFSANAFIVFVLSVTLVTFLDPKQVTAQTAASITSPINGSTLSGSTVTFQWDSGTGISQYFLYVGNSVGANDIYGQSQGTNRSVTITGLPTDGRTLYVRLWSLAGSTWLFKDYTYNAATGGGTAASITSPTPGSTFTSSSVIFTWDTGTGVTQYWLYVGKTVGGSDLYNSSQGTNHSVTVNGLPTNGSTVYVRLWSLIGNTNTWLFKDYTYFATTSAASWSVTLAASSTRVARGAPVTLTATANQDVGPTPYYIQILDVTTVDASCGSGTTCTTSTTSFVALTLTFVARVARFDGTSVQATSAPVSVTWVSPTVTTQPATNIASNAATLNGTVNPNGFTTTVSFQWGATTSYGNTTPAQSIGSGNSNVSVSANLSGLSPGTTYHYRVTATTTAATFGSDMSFTTTPTTDCVQVNDVTPAHYVVNASATFTKTWSFKNCSSTITWNGYRLYFVSGNQFSGPSSVTIPTTTPGSTVNVSVPLQAPSSPTCAAMGQSGTWQIKNSGGTAVPGGATTVVITVNPTSGSPIPNLVSVSYGYPGRSVNPLVNAGFGGQCTAFAWGRANEKKLIADLPTGNAKDWYHNTIYPTGQIASINSIAAWGVCPQSSLGHLAYVEVVNGSNLTLNEANLACFTSDNWGGGYDKAPTPTTLSLVKSRLGGNCFQGFIYLDAPSVSSINPVSGPAGTIVTITGVRFGENIKNGFKVTFGSALGTVQSWNDTTITVKVPTGSGPVTVKVVTTAGPSNSTSFTYK